MPSTSFPCSRKPSLLANVTSYQIVSRWINGGVANLLPQHRTHNTATKHPSLLTPLGSQRHQACPSKARYSYRLRPRSPKVSTTSMHCRPFAFRFDDARDPVLRTNSAQLVSSRKWTGWGRMRSVELAQDLEPPAKPFSG